MVRWRWLWRCRPWPGGSRDANAAAFGGPGASVVTPQLTVSLMSRRPAPTHAASPRRSMHASAEWSHAVADLHPAVRATTDALWRTRSVDGHGIPAEVAAAATASGPSPRRVGLRAVSKPCPGQPRTHRLPPGWRAAGSSSPIPSSIARASALPGRQHELLLDHQTGRLSIAAERVGSSVCTQHVTVRT